MRFLQLCPDSGKLQNGGTTLLGRAFRPRVRARLARICDGQVPYGSLASVMARDVHGHAEFASARQTGLVAAQLIVGVVFVPMIVPFSGAGAGVMTQKGYTLAALILFFAYDLTEDCFHRISDDLTHGRWEHGLLDAHEPDMAGGASA